MTAQPTDDEARAVTPRYSHQTLVRIKHARVARDLTLCIGGVVFTILSFVIPVPSYTVNDAIWILALVVAVVFGTAALIRGLAEPTWTRKWSSLGLRCGCTIAAILVGLYFMAFALVQSGYTGLRGQGLTSNCRYVSSGGLTHGGSHAYLCDVDVRWSDGTTTREDLNATQPVASGKVIGYAKAPKTGLLSIFPVGDQPITAWTNVWFYLLAGLAIFLSALFALCVALFAKRPKGD